MGELRGDALEQRGLPAALLQEIETLRANAPDAPEVGFQVKGTHRRLPDPLGHGLWRVTQEALADRIKAGTVWLHTWHKYHPNAPFGGYKMSGCGREQGAEALENHTQHKTVWANLGRPKSRRNRC